MRRGNAPGPTLEVYNAGAASVDLHLIQGVSVLGDTIGYSLGTVFAGSTACYQLQSVSTPQWVKVRSLDGAFLTPSFIAANRPAWSLELRGNPLTDPLALEPADEQCTPGARPTSR
jgi:hypothetical protein